MQLRPATEKDISQLCQLAKIPQFTISTSSDEVIKHFVTDFVNKGDTIVADDNGIIGFAMGFLYRGGIYYLDAIMIKEEYRGKGIGSQLLAEMERIAKQKGARTVYLHVISTNESAQHLYKKKGYEKGEVLVEYEKQI